MIEIQGHSILVFSVMAGKITQEIRHVGLRINTYNTGTVPVLN